MNGEGKVTSIDLSNDERRAIASLKRLAKRWPKTLWLFTNGDISILKCDEDGGRAHVGESIDQSYVVATIVGILSDGGDW